MSFYVIQENWGGYENFFEDGVFDENGIKEAAEILCNICEKRIKDKISYIQKSLIQHEKDRDLLCDVRDFYKTTKGSCMPSNFGEEKIKEFAEKIIREQKEIDEYKNLLNSSDKNVILNKYGYKIVEVPVFDYCNEKLLKDFI